MRNSIVRRISNMQTVHRALPQNWCRRLQGAIVGTSANSGLGAPNCDCLSVYADRVGLRRMCKNRPKRKQSAVSRAENLNAEEAEVAEAAKYRATGELDAFPL